MSKQTGEIAEKIYRSSEGFWIQILIVGKLSAFVKEENNL